MSLVYRNVYKLLHQKTNIRCISAIFCIKKSIDNKLSSYYSTNYAYLSLNTNTFFQVKFGNTLPQLEGNRYFSKKKGSKRNVQVEEESESEDEEEYESYQDEMSDNVITKTVPSMRLDTVIKAGLGLTKKKIEKSFYANKIRVNGEKVLKKAFHVALGDEVDYIKDYSPENKKFLLVDRLIIKSIANVTGTGMYPVKMEVLKGLTIENYADPWIPSSVTEMD